MPGPDGNLSYSVQVWGLLLTLVGTLASIGGLVWAYLAAHRAQAARDAAVAARAAALRAARVAQLSDLIAEMQELQVMLAREDFPSMAAKCTRLRGRVVRFKQEAYTELTEMELENLDLARAQLETIGKVAAVGKAEIKYRLGQIQIAFGHANEAVNAAFAIHGKTDGGGKNAT